MSVGSAWSRLRRGHPDRITRFHSGRDELMPPSAWVRLPVSVLRRATGRADDRPWLVPTAVERLDELIGPDWDVLELGSGSSTAWYARRARSVLSLEDDAEWFAVVTERIANSGLTNIELRQAPVDDFPGVVVDAVADKSFDLLVVDSNDGEQLNRIGLLKALLPRVEAGGYVLLDDSDRADVREVDEILAGWPFERFVGIKPYPFTAMETTVYRRPGAG